MLKKNPKTTGLSRPILLVIFKEKNEIKESAAAAKAESNPT